MSERIQLDTKGKERVNRMLFEQLAFDRHAILTRLGLHEVTLEETIRALHHVATKKKIHTIDLGDDKRPSTNAKGVISTITREEHKEAGLGAERNAITSRQNKEGRGNTRYSIGPSSYEDISKEELSLIAEHYKPCVNEDEFIAAYQGILAARKAPKDNLLTKAQSIAKQKISSFKAGIVAVLVDDYPKNKNLPNKSAEEYVNGLLHTHQDNLHEQARKAAKILEAHEGFGSWKVPKPSKTFNKRCTDHSARGNQAIKTGILTGLALQVMLDTTGELTIEGLIEQAVESGQLPTTGPGASRRR